MPTLIRSASERFAERRLGRWTLLAEATRADAARRPLGRGAALDFARLYRRACRDLAEARARRLSSEVVEYLNALVGSAHSALYGRAKRGGFAAVARKSLGVLARHRAAYALAAALFFLPLGLAFAATSARPETARYFVDADALDAFGRMYESPSFDSDAARGAGGAAFYVQHNTTISFLCFATGILFGAGSVYFLLYNGLFIGALGGYIAAAGHGENFLRFVLAHSALELPGVVMAGAAGLYLGSLALRGGKRGRAAQLREGLEEVIAMLVPATVLIFLAAIVEGFVSGSSAPIWLRASIFGTSLAALSAFLIIPLMKRFPFARGKRG